jgi:hypothetical protein
MWTSNGLQLGGRLVPFLRRLAMSKWSRLKVALLAATATLSALGMGLGCLGDNWYQRVVQYTVIGNLFD